MKNPPLIHQRRGSPASLHGHMARRRESEEEDGEQQMGAYWRRWRWSRVLRAPLAEL